MKQIKETPLTQQDLGKLAQVTAPLAEGHTLVVERTKTTKLTVSDAPYMADDTQCFSMMRAAKGMQDALYPAVASMFVRYGMEWESKASTGTTKERAKIISKAAREWLAEKVGKPVTGNASVYVATLARARAQKFDVVSKSGEDGKPEALFGWSFVVKSLADTKEAETCDAALQRASKIIGTHAGSKFTSGILDKQQGNTMLAALVSVFGFHQVSEMLTAQLAGTEQPEDDESEDDEPQSQPQ